MEGARSSLPCISAHGSIHHLVLSAPLLRIYLSSLNSLCTSTIFPAFCLLCILRYMPFSLITFRMHADAARFARPSPVTRFLYFRVMHRDARGRSCKWGDLGLRNAKISSTYTRRFSRKREATSWDSLATKRRISNYDLLLLLHLPLPALLRQSAFHV